MHKILSMNEKKLHGIILTAGMLITLIPLFHDNLWFDEAYTAAISSQPYERIISIGVHDVHPLLYYFLLHPIALIFPDAVLAERMFSWICLNLSAWFGYFVLARTYGRRTGMLFSLFVFFFPPDIVYAGEMRMYMLVMFLVTVSAYEAERILHAPGRKHRILFVLFSIASAYTHYYGLLAVCILNLILLVHCLWKRDFKGFVTWLLMAAIQIASYLPWFAVLFRQSGAVSQNFWIEWKWPQSLMDMVLFFFTGNLEKSVYVPAFPGIAFAVIFCFLLFRKGRKNQSAWIYLLAWSGTILAGGLASLILHRTVLYPRYLLVCHGCILLAFALWLNQAGKKTSLVLSASCLVLTLTACFSLCRINYDASNGQMFDLLKKEMKPEDTLLVSNYGQDPNSFTALPRIHCKKVIYWNELGWSEESIRAYEAFGNLVVNDHPDLSRVHGRLWVLYGNDDEIGHEVSHVNEEVQKQWGQKPQETWFFPTAYKDIEYSLALFQRD